MGQICPMDRKYWKWIEITGNLYVDRGIAIWVRQNQVSWTSFDSALQMCAIYIAMQRYRPISVILSDIVTVRIRHGLTILGLKIN